MRTLWMIGAAGLLVACRGKATDTLDVDTGALAVTDADSDGYNAEEDCDDDNSSINPGATEICDGIDNDCDLATDEGVTSTFYADSDADGFGDDSEPAEACSEPTGYVAVGNDCDDSDPETYPGAPERCDGIDNNCDGAIDEDVLTAWFADADGDGFGDQDAAIDDCNPPDGYVEDWTDCDDTTDETYPGAPETCDEADNDCDKVVDEGVTTTYYVDSDADGYGDADDTTEACSQPKGYAAVSGDCDDGEATTSPGADEYCDKVDNDCDKAVDEDDAVDALEWYADDDGDSYGDPDDTTEACSQPSGYLSDDTDCDDGEASTNPGADEYCDKVDNDCDGTLDNDDALDAPTWYIDYDGDGYGADTFTAVQCDQPKGYLSDSTDCDDRDEDIYPGADEYCDEVDSDCDGTLDNDDALDADTWYADDDGDSYGDPDSTTTACAEPSGYLADNTDCHDDDATAYPGSMETETPNDGIDTDCDGNDHCTDLNCDGLVDLVQGVHYSGSSYAASSRIFYNDGTGFSDADVASLPTYGGYDAAVADLDGDGYQDIVFANYRSDSSYTIDSYVYYGSATGHSTADRAELPTAGATEPYIADFDDDGYLDIFFSNYYTGTYSVNSYVYYGSVSGFTTTSRDVLPGTGTLDARIGDVDNDGYTDIVMACYYSGSSYSTNSYVYYGSSTGFSTANRDSMPTLGARDVAIEDLNGDGLAEIIFANYYSGSSYSTNSYVYYGTSTGYTTAYRDSLPTYGTLGVTVADIDQDGYPDLAFGGYHRGSWSTTAPTMVYYNSSLGFSSSVYDSIATRGIRELISEDIDRDGYPDLVMPQYYSGSSYVTSSYVYYGSASGLGSYESLPTIGASRAAVGDIDQDGLADIVFNNYYSGSWSSPPDSYVYYGATSGYSTADRVDLTTEGAWPTPILVGNSDW